MSTYKEIRGINIQSRDAGPTALEGDVWYNTGASILKMYTVGAGTWATGDSINTARMTGTTAKNAAATAALITGGETSPPTSTGATETYDGSSWTETGDLNLARSEMAGAGTATAALCFSGWNVSGDAYNPECESFDGSSWTEVGDVNYDRGEGDGCGTQTAALFFGGQNSDDYSPWFGTYSESWDGSSWTEGPNTNAGRGYVGGCGVQTAALMYAGNPAPLAQLTESYDGSSWTEVGDLNADSYSGGAFGIQTAAVAAGGDPGRKVTVEEWNGTSWTEVNNVSVARNSTFASAAGGISAGYLTGGQLATAGMSNATEDWVQAVAAQTIAVD